LPKVEIVDFTQERRKRYEYTGKAGVHLLSIRLEAAIKQTLDAKAGTLLLLNRRGYANYIACPDHHCGWMMKCDYCDATMVYHKDATLPDGGYLHCHHCTAKQMLPKWCPLCGKKVTVFGLGTQRVEEELARKFPTARLLRMDSDSMRGARDYEASLDRFRSGQIDILLGTQMIAKGLDFPNVRLVGVISADTALHMPDFRASERTFQLVAQVAGRTGRGSEPGTVIVQTFSPDDPAITLAARHDYETFAARELNLRSEMGLPPVTRMARIVVRDKDHVRCVAQASALATHLNEANAALALHVRIRGPAACPISRIAEFYRMQIEMIAADAATLQKLLTALRNARLLKSDQHTAVDVDPVDLL
jgi:primosomal protein N' (replication factor Y)